MIGGSVEEHDAALQKVLSALTGNAIAVNADKYDVFNMEEIRLVGLVFNKYGIKPALKNVRKLKGGNQPSWKAELRSFLGVADFSKRFIPNCATIKAKPLQNSVKFLLSPQFSKNKSSKNKSSCHVNTML